MFDVQRLKGIVGDDWVITDRSQMERYLVDETYTGLVMKPADHVVVVKPANAVEISRVMKLANELGFVVYPRGGGTGVCAGSIPTRDGVVLSLERLDKVLEVDKENLMVVAEAGVTLGQLLQAVEAEDLLFPPHPGDEGAQLGGLVACNAGGTRAVKYGVVRNYVKGLEVVLPTGEIVSMGGKLLKNNTGLDLMHLMIDSEGILGIITSVTLRLYPKFAGHATLVGSLIVHHSLTRSPNCSTTCRTNRRKWPTTARLRQRETPFASGREAAASSAAPRSAPKVPPHPTRRTSPFCAP